MAKRQPSRFRAKPVEYRWEPDIAAGGALTALDRDLRAEGFARAAKVRASLRRGRFFTVRFTWSKAVDGLKRRISHIEQFDLASGRETIIEEFDARKGATT
jgi:hypothetical protein